MPSTGRLVNHDPASRAYAAPRAAVRPVSWSHRLGPVLDQDGKNGCVGWTGANFLNAAVAVGNRARFWAGRTQRYPWAYLGNAEGEDLYRAATRRDPFQWTYPPTDGGSSALGLGKALRDAGVIEQYLWTFDFGQMLAHGAKQPLLLGLVWTDAMSDPNAKGIISIGSEAGLRSAIDAELGHEVLLRGVNWPRKLARLRNQWSADWGDRGEAWIPLADLERLIIDHRGDVLVPTLAPRPGTGALSN